MGKATIRMTTHGTAEVRGRFERLDRATWKRLRSAISQTTRAVKAGAQARLPVSSRQVKFRTHLGGRLGLVGRVTSPGIGIFIERGRRAGKMPPSFALQAWAIRRGIVRKEARAIGRARRLGQVEQLPGLMTEMASTLFAIARAIGRRGVPARPFMAPAAEAERSAFEQRVRFALEEAVAETEK